MYMYTYTYICVNTPINIFMFTCISCACPREQAWFRVHTYALSVYLCVYIDMESEGGREGGREREILLLRNLAIRFWVEALGV